MPIKGKNRAAHRCTPHPSRSCTGHHRPDRISATMASGLDDHAVHDDYRPRPSAGHTGVRSASLQHRLSPPAYLAGNDCIFGLDHDFENTPGRVGVDDSHGFGWNRLSLDVLGLWGIMAKAEARFQPSGVVHLSRSAAVLTRSGYCAPAIPTAAPWSS